MDKGAQQPIAAEDVVACGESPQCIQLPSPVYFARWIDERHAIVGAGGGGRRFGMANLLAIVSVNTMPPRRTRTPPGKKSMQQPRLTETLLCPWSFVSAVDMEGNIPWCASSFLPCADETGLSSGVWGHLAVSHISCFTLVEVRQCPSTRKISMQRVACIELPSDAKNPDKKPIAMVQGAVVVAHDDGGVHVYSLSSLLHGVPAVGVGGPDATHLHSVGNGERRTGTTSVAAEAEAEAAASSMVTEAKPLAVWPLPARVNDLHANRFFVPRKKRNGDGSSRSSHSNYLLIAALVQDKTLRLTTMKLRPVLGSADNPNNRKKCGSRHGERCHPAGLVDACALTGRDCRIPFSLMKSSMRLVHLCGVEDVVPSTTEELWKGVRHLHCRGNARGAMPAASLVVVVYDVVSNQSYMLAARVLSTAVRADEESLLHNSLQPTAEAAANDGGKNPKRLALRVLFTPKPSPIVGEGVTSICPCHYYHSSPDSAAVSGEGVGTVIPSHWLVGTVEGSLVSVVYGDDGEFHVQSIRPERSRRKMGQFPALHKEPISSVAVSRLNDVLTTDIAQKVVVSVLPFWGQSSVGLLSCKNVDKASCPNNRASHQSRNVIRPFVISGDNTMAAASSASLVDASAGGSGNGMVMCSKYETLALFPLKRVPSMPLFLWWGISLTIEPYVVAVGILLVGVLCSYWML